MVVDYEYPANVYVLCKATERVLQSRDQWWGNVGRGVFFRYPVSKTLISYSKQRRPVRASLWNAFIEPDSCARSGISVSGKTVEMPEAG